MAVSKLTCPDCGVSFVQKSSRHKRCTPCGERHDKERRSAWFKNYRKIHNEYFLEYARQRRREQGMQPFESRERENRRIRRKAILDRMGHRCSVCGYDRCVANLHLHHVDAARKKGDKDYQRKSFTDFGNLALLCANCHFEVHYGVISLSPSKPL